MGLSFRVNEHKRIPRQDTETLVEEAIWKSKSGDQVLDMCTGSGCILLSLLKLVLGLTGTGVDISGEAFKSRCGKWKEASDGGLFFESDLFEKVEGSFGLIVSNPPYIASEEIPTLMEEVRIMSPSAPWMEARTAGNLPQAGAGGKEHVKPGGWMLFEIEAPRLKRGNGTFEKRWFLDVYVKKGSGGAGAGRRRKETETGGEKRCLIVWKIYSSVWKRS